MKRQKSHSRPLRKFILISALVHLGILTLLALAFRIEPLTGRGGIIGLSLWESHTTTSRLSSKKPTASRETTLHSPKSKAQPRAEKPVKSKKPSSSAREEPREVAHAAPPIERIPGSLEETSTREKTPKGLSSPGTPGYGTLEVAHPMYKLNPKPAYPSIAKRRGYKGTVYLRVRVSERGTVESVEIERSSGYPSLDSSAVKAVRRWLFAPGTRNGVAVTSWVTVPIDFRLRQGD